MLRVGRVSRFPGTHASELRHASCLLCATLGVVCSTEYVVLQVVCHIETGNHLGNHEARQQATRLTV